MMIFYVHSISFTCPNILKNSSQIIIKYFRFLCIVTRYFIFMKINLTWLSWRMFSLLYFRSDNYSWVSRDLDLFNPLFFCWWNQTDTRLISFHWLIDLNYKKIYDRTVPIHLFVIVFFRDIYLFISFFIHPNPIHFLCLFYIGQSIRGTLKAQTDENIKLPCPSQTRHCKLNTSVEPNTISNAKYRISHAKYRNSHAKYRISSPSHI